MENPRPRVSSLRSKIRPSWIIATSAAAAAVFVAADWLRVGRELSAAEQVASRRILDRYGRELRHSLDHKGERQTPLAVEAIPDVLRHAFVLSEDRRFFEHSGVDVRALGRGAWQSLTGMRAVSGGSTITMQLVRTRWPELSGPWHKPAQMLQAYWIEQTFSKAEILESYLNQVPFGHKIAGVGEACAYFYDKACEQLSPAEAAALAILPRNPSLLTRRLDQLKSRRDRLLDDLLVGQDPLVLEQAKTEPISFARKAPELHAPHLTERILRETSAAEVRTTIDLELQTEIQKLLAAEAIKRKSTGDSGAVLVVSNRTGEVLAYVGSPDYFDPVSGTFDGVQALRSPGSALKPFVYELALENNWNLFNLVPDIPMTFSTQRAVYEPHNYGGNFSGPRTIREALGNSKNLPVLYMTSVLGEAKVLGHLQKIGFTSLNQSAAFYGVGLSLGNGEVSLWDLTRAYSTLARLGVDLPLTYLKSENRGKQTRVMTEETAFLIADVLRDPEARKEEFGRHGPLEFEYEVGVKTGTSTNYKDHWTIGFTEAVTVGVWRGNSNSSPFKHRISASQGAGPLFHQVMDLVHAHRNPKWIEKPEGVTASTVCAVSGQKPGPHCSLKQREWHVKGAEPTHECDFHKTIEVENCRGRRQTITYVVYPSEYAEWVKSSKAPTLENQLREKCGGTAIPLVASRDENMAPQIVEPLDRTTFAIDPTIPLSHQELRFGLRGLGREEKIQVLVNDEPRDLTIEDGQFHWPLQKGKFKFQLKKGQVVSNAVEIQVL